MHSAVCAPSALLLSFSFFYCTRAHRDLHSFPTRRSSDLGRVIDATGKVVVPGGIDPHTHLAHPIMSHPDEPGLTLGPEEDTRGMLFGGTTTHIDFAFVRPGGDIRSAIEQRSARWKGDRKSVV